MPKMPVRQSGFACSACGPFTKNSEWIQNLKETGDWRYIYQFELGKACFQLDMAYGDFKDLPRKVAFDNILDVNKIKFDKIMDIKEVLLQWVKNLFDKKNLLLVMLKLKLWQTSNQLKNYTNYLLAVIWVGRGAVVILQRWLVGFPLITQKQWKLWPWHFAAFSDILVETSMWNLVFLTRPGLQILSKTQIEVSLISGFLVNRF